MDVKLTLNNWKEARKRDSTTYKRKLRLVRQSAETISELGEEFSFSFIDNGKVKLSATADDGAGARALASRAREVLGVKESAKELDSGSGHIRYITANEKIIAVVYGGDVPSNCYLIPKAQSYITYEMVCQGEKVG